MIIHQKAREEMNAMLPISSGTVKNCFEEEMNTVL